MIFRSSDLPVTSRTDENIKKINEIVLKDVLWVFGWCKILQTLIERQKSFAPGFAYDENLCKTGTKIPDMRLKNEQKKHLLWHHGNTDPELFENVITYNKMWIFQYDPETKWKSMHWNASTLPRVKKAWMSKSKLEVVLIVFFDISDIIMIERLTSRQMVNQQFYI